MSEHQNDNKMKERAYTNVGEEEDLRVRKMKRENNKNIELEYNTNSERV